MPMPALTSAPLSTLHILPQLHPLGIVGGHGAYIAVLRQAADGYLIACTMHALTAEVLVQIESKIFFCDAKTNMRGLYLKVSEKKANRERSTIIVPGRSLPWFRELFNYYATTDPTCVPCIAMSARLISMLHGQ